MAALQHQQHQSATRKTLNSVQTTSQTPLKKKTMSITQTYFLAHKARAKLSSEASRADHNLRLLVGHANLLDSLMLELADAEREQESWFNQSVRGATKSEKSQQQQKPSQDRHIQWADSVVEEPEADWEADDIYSDSSSESDLSELEEDDVEEDEDVEMMDSVALTRVPSHKSLYNRQQQQDYEEDMEEDDDEEEDFAQLTLTRSPSHSPSTPPELDDDSDSSEDEQMPPSPPSAVIRTFSEKEKESIATTGYYASETQQRADKDAFYGDSVYVPARNPARLVSSISVY